MKKDIAEYYAQYGGDLTRLCVSLCGNNAEAEDLFQETWVRAMKNLDKYDEERPFDKWLFSICVNLFKNRVKLFENSRRHEFGSEEEKQAFFDSIPDKDAGDPERFYELHSAVMRLPKKLRAVIVLYYFRDHSVKETSEILGIPEGTVKSRLNAARQQIKRRLDYE